MTKLTAITKQVPTLFKRSFSQFFLTKPKAAER